MKTKDVVSYGSNVAGWTLSVSRVISEGLSVVRQMSDITSAPGAQYVACCASVVEGEIYQKNIIEGSARFIFLRKESFLARLIVTKFNSGLEEIAQHEKMLRENLFQFLSDIKNKQEIYKFSAEEITNVDKYLALFKPGEEQELKEEDLKSFFIYYKKLISSKEDQCLPVITDDKQRFKTLQRIFEELTKKKRGTDCAFLVSYQTNQMLLNRAKASERASEIEEAENRLKLLEKMLVEYTVHPAQWQFLYVPVLQASEGGEVIFSSDINPTLLKVLQGELPSAMSKLWLLRFGALFSIFVAVAVGMVAFYTFPAVLAGLGLVLSCTALSAIIWPLAILAAISYGILIYNTIADLIINETLTIWWRALKQEVDGVCDKKHLLKYLGLIVWKTLSQIFTKIINWFKPRPKESWFSYGLRVVLSLVVISFGIISSIATGYTAFIQLQAYVSVVVCVITALPLLLGDLLFTLKNSFESIALLTEISFEILVQPVREGWTKLTAQVQTENYLQLILHLIRLPLIFLLSFFKLSIFLLHVFFTSVASDRLFTLPCWAALFFTAVSELLTDISPLFGKTEGENHNHDHGGLFDYAAKLIFIGPATLLGVLNWIFSQLNRCSSNSTLKVLTFSEAVLHEWEQFNIWHKHPESKNEDVVTIDPATVQVPKSILYQKAIMICDKEIKRLEQGFFKSEAKQEKAKIFSQCRAKLVGNYQTEEMLTSEGLIGDIEKGKLARHRLSRPWFRFFNPSRLTRSTMKLDKIQALLTSPHELLSSF